MMCVREIHMKISRVIIENYRNLKNVDVTLGNTVTLIGENNCGKSNFLRALSIPLLSDDSGNSKHLSWHDINREAKEAYYTFLSENKETSVYKGYKQDKIEMRGDRAEMSDFPLYLNTVAGGLDRRDQTIGGFSFVVKIYAVPVVEIIG